MFRRVSIVALTLGLIVASFVGSATAADPEWREKQEARFEQIGLKPGDIIEPAEWQKVDGLLPPQMVEWVKKGYLGDMKIAEFKYDPEADDEWINAGLKNAGKFKLDEKKSLVEAATGKVPLWIYGDPFPNLNIKNDPDGAIKFMYNRDLSLRRFGSYRQEFSAEWVGQNGYERSCQGYYLRYYYWGRPDGKVPNPRRYNFLDIAWITEPYDVAGTIVLTVRKMDGTEDDVYAYIPAIRRVKKMSGANRSDPFMGLDLCVDDAALWQGLTNSMKWRFVEEKVGLLHLVEWVAEHPNRMKQISDGTWRSPPDEIPPKYGWEVEGWKHSPWAAVNVVWVPRTFVIVEAIPVDPYYNYGKTVYWIDKKTYATSYKPVWDRAGEYWKTILFLPRCAEWAGKRGFQTGSSTFVFDEKTGHACTGHHGGPWKGTDCYTEFSPPDVTPRTFTTESLRKLSK